MRPSRRLSALITFTSLLSAGACQGSAILPAADSYPPQLNTQDPEKTTAAVPLSGATTTTDSTSRPTERGPGLGSGH